MDYLDRHVNNQGRGIGRSATTTRSLVIGLGEIKNLSHSLGSFRYNRDLAITINATAIPEIDERAHFKQMMCTSVNIQMKKEHSQLYYSP